jgi:hypothetical protein
LQSFEQPTQTHIEGNYNALIDRISQALDAPKFGDAIAYNDDTWTLQIITRVTEWTSRTYYDHDSKLNGYVNLKLFVIMFHISQIAPPEVKDLMTGWATTAMDNVDMFRLSICEGIILSFFLKRPFIEHRNRQLMENIRNQLNFDTLWDKSAILPSSDIKIRIIDYMKTVVFPSELTQHNGSIDYFKKAMRDFRKEVRYMVGVAEAKNVHKNITRQLIEWVRITWDRLFYPGNNYLGGYRESYITATSGPIGPSAIGGPGPSH